MPKCHQKRTLTNGNSYTRPPTLDITLEEFETFAIERLRVLSHIESLQHRSLPYQQLQGQIGTYLKTHLPLSSNTARSANLEGERRADEIGHWVLRLAFCRRCVMSREVAQLRPSADGDSPDLRARFVRSEVALFKHRFETDDQNERAEFLRGVNTQGEEVKRKEKSEIEGDLRKCMWNMKEDAFQAEVFFKVSPSSRSTWPHNRTWWKPGVS